MAPQPTAAQRRVIDAADPDTGRLRGTATQLEGLVRRGLAFRHPRPPHDHFLTPAGHRIREDVPGTAVPAPARPADPAPATDVFAARVGGEAHPPAAATGPARAREVRSAWQGLLELRRMTRPDASTDLPCAWERGHLVRAAALALEAADHRPAGPHGDDGYRVRDTPQPEAVAVHGAAGASLSPLADTLEAAGWQTGEHTEPRTRTRYLLASPRRV
ncbi:hypothetical protein [Streptomyces sp. NPDC008150]|uniref:hypothetical protein n=1 Tax=Streptomyces sp. NPDC008150 TaxID=3364816 RepID=UPI0036F0B4F2